MNKDVQIAKYFIPTQLKHIEITKEDENKYVEWSSQGKHKTDIKRSHFTDGFNTLIWGKKRAGLHMGLWEEAVLEGSIPYCDLIPGLPKHIREFAAKEMFKGEDRQIILNIR